MIFATSVAMVILLLYSLPISADGECMCEQEHQRALILIADDELAILSLLHEILTDEGFIVEQVSNGQDALSAVWTSLPALIVTDLMMPMMDGRMLASQLHHQSRTAHIPILLISAGYRAQADDCFTAVLSKPFDIGVFLDTVNALLTK